MSKQFLILLYTNLSSTTAKASTKPDVLHSWPQAEPLQCCWDPIYPWHWQGWDPVCPNREEVNPEKVLSMLVWPLHLPSCCSSVGEAKNTLLSKNPFSIRGGAVVTTEMAPHSQSPETTSHYCDCRELPENLLLQVRPWLQPGSPPRPTQLPQLPDRGW